MSVAKQLFDLQELDLDLDARHAAVKQMTARLGESKALLDARAALSEARQNLDRSAADLRSLEWEIDDITAKLKTMERDLYGGRIRIPKELSSLQQEVATLRNRRSQLEDRALEMMETVERQKKTVADLSERLSSVEAAWQKEQAELKAGIEKEEGAIAELQPRRKRAAQGIDAESLALYETLRRQKGAAVSRVEQGICRGCRISLPASELQRARGGSLVQCGNCGRILYLP